MKKLIHSKPKILIRCNASLAEGPVWNHRTKEFSFVDILNQNVFICKNKKRIKKFNSREMISNFLPSKNNSWISCGKNKVFQIKIKKNKIFCKKLISIKHRKNNRFNDASIDSQGRLWASTMDENEVSNSGNLFFFQKINSPKKLLGNFVSPIVMGIIFFGVVTPTGLILKLFSKDILNLKKNKNDTYWLKKDNSNNNMKNQF